MPVKESKRVGERRRDHDGVMERQRDTLRDVNTKITYGLGQSRY